MNGEPPQHVREVLREYGFWDFSLDRLVDDPNTELIVSVGPYFATVEIDKDDDDPEILRDRDIVVASGNGWVFEICDDPGEAEEIAEALNWLCAEFGRREVPGYAAEAGLGVDPDDPVGALALADWLEEQGRLTEARRVRLEAKRRAHWDRRFPQKSFGPPSRLPGR